MFRLVDELLVAVVDLAFLLVEVALLAAFSMTLSADKPPLDRIICGRFEILLIHQFLLHHYKTGPLQPKLNSKKKCCVEEHPATRAL